MTACDVCSQSILLRVGHACSKAEAQGGPPGVLMMGWDGGNASVPVKRMEYGEEEERMDEEDGWEGWEED